jgi:hypothetical protein
MEDNVGQPVDQQLLIFQNDSLAPFAASILRVPDFADGGVCQFDGVEHGKLSAGAGPGETQGS